MMVVPARVTTPTSTCRPTAYKPSNSSSNLNSRIKAFICSSKGMGILLVAFITFLSISSRSVLSVENESMMKTTTKGTTSNVNVNDNGNGSDGNEKSSKATTKSSSSSSLSSSSSFGQLLPNCQVDSFPNTINMNLNINTTSNTEANNKTIRWSQHNVPTSTINSPFNCFLPNSLCTYYYPADFFDPKCGLGKQYNIFLQQAEEMRQNRTLWMNMPAVGFPTLTLNHTCYSTTQVNRHGVYDIIPNPNYSKDSNHNVPLNRATLHNIGSFTLEPEQANNAYGHPSTLQCMTERVSMLHVHKVGGTSLHSAFDMADSMGRGKGVLQIRHKFFTPSRGPDSRPLFSGGGLDILHRTESTLYLDTLESLTKYATTYPEKVYEPEQHLVFAFVRDPVDRFISSLGQALGASGSQGNQIGPVLKEECVVDKETSGEVLKCIAKYVQEHGFWIELHFTPQVIDISFTTLWTDIPIAVFPFKELRTVLDYFGSGNVTRRDGGSAGYRSNKLLTDMTVDDYDEETLKIVCSIYEMDVIMQRSLGFDAGRCDPYVPK